MRQIRTKIRSVETKEKLCTFAGCDCKKETNGEEKLHHYLVFDIEIPSDEEKTHQKILESTEGRVRMFEANVRESPNVKSNIIFTLLKDDIVTIIERKDCWLHVKNNITEGWVFSGNIKREEEPNLSGEIHQTYLCEKAIEKINWSKFYLEQIEPHQEQHVIGDYQTDYIETKLATKRAKGTGEDIDDIILLPKEIEDELLKVYEEKDLKEKKRWNIKKALQRILQ